jgi:hypothetical protein
VRKLKPGQTLPKGAVVLSKSPDAHPAKARGKQDREAGAPRRVRGRGGGEDGGGETPGRIKQQQLMFERTTGGGVCG